MHIYYEYILIYIEKLDNPNIYGFQLNFFEALWLLWREIHRIVLFN